MYFKICLAFLVIFINSLFADDIFLKSGEVWVNVKVLEIGNSKVKIKKTNRAINTLDKDKIISINKIEVDWYSKSRLISKEEYSSEYLNSNNERISYINKGTSYFPVSIVSLIIGIDYLATANDYNGIIKKFEKQGINTKGEKNIRDRKKTIGYILIATSAISAFFTVFSVKKVVVKSENSKVILSYNF